MIKHCLAILLMSSPLLSSSLPRDHFFRIDRSSGLVQNQVNAVVQDSLGFLWIATSEGLNRSDGNTYKEYRYLPDDPTSLSHSYCYALCHDAERNCLWVGTLGGGLNAYWYEKASFEQILPGDIEDKKPEKEDILTIVLDRENTLWYGGNNGLFRLERMKNKPTRVPLKKGNADEAPWRITALSVTRDKILLLGTDQGLWAYSSDSLSHIPLSTDSESVHKIWAIHSDPFDSIFVGTEKNGLYTLDHQFVVKNKLFPTESINVIRTDSHQRLWIGTYGQGLHCLPSHGDRIISFRHQPDRPQTISSNYINSLFQSSDGQIWIGSDNGLCRYDSEHEKITHYSRLTGTAATLESDDISTLLESPKNELWIGTSGGGINRFMADKTGFKPITQKNSKGIRLSHDTLMKMVLDQNGTIWAATSNGLNEISSDGEVMSHFFSGPSSPHFLKSNLIITLLTDKQNRLWIGYNDSGVSILDVVTKSFHHLPNTLIPSPSIWSFYLDTDQSVWIGTRDGLFHLSNSLQKIAAYTHNATQTESLSNNWINAILRDSSGDLWVGTAGGGLCRLDEKSGRFRTYQRKHGLSNETVLSLIEDEQKNIWVSTNQGLNCLLPDRERFRTFSRAHGFASEEFNMDCALKLQDGRLAYGSGNGLDIFHPAELLKFSPSPWPIFTSLLINNQEQRLVPAIEYRSDIALGYGRDIVSVEFSTIDFRDPLATRYQYRLSGWKTQWIETDARNRRATFSQLPPGEYILELKTFCPDQGDVQSIPSQLHIHIPAPFWRRLWFITICALLFSFASYLLINFLSTHFQLRRFWKKTTQISTYKIETLIGSGGMADVYSGRSLGHPALKVAIKILRDDLKSDPVSLRRFRQEAAIIDQLDHPNIVRIFERGSQGERPYIIMELLQGAPLSHRVNRDRGTSLQEAIPIIIQTCSALEKIHQKGILHRDLKPANIMLLNPPQGKITVKLLDFGLARMTHQSRMTQSGTVMGTLCYLAPELITVGDAGSSSDVFSLGVVIYELLTGSLPYSGSSAGDILNQILVEVPPLLSEKGIMVPLEIERMVDMMLAKSPDVRPSPREIMDLLKQHQGE